MGTEQDIARLTTAARALAAEDALPDRLAEALRQLVVAFEAEADLVVACRAAGDREEVEYRRGGW